MTMTNEQAAWFAETFEKLVANVGRPCWARNTSSG